jgi:hypothetical protein
MLRVLPHQGHENSGIVSWSRIWDGCGWAPISLLCLSCFEMQGIRESEPQKALVAVPASQREGINRDGTLQRKIYTKYSRHRRECECSTFFYMSALLPLLSLTLTEQHMNQGRRHFRDCILAPILSSSAACHGPDAICLQGWPSKRVGRHEISAAAVSSIFLLPKETGFPRRLL